MKKLLLAGAAMMVLTGSAMAADPVVGGAPAIAPPPVFSWTGPYVGAFAGYGFGYSSATNDPAAGGGDGFDDGALPLTLGLTPRGLLGGVAVGYNRQTGAFVVGAEVTGGFLSMADAFSLFIADGANGVLDDDEGMVGYGWYATLSGRIGVAADRTLLFATAGGIVTQFSAAFGDLDAGVTDPSDATALGGPQYGYLVGAGAEFAFDTNWTAKLEYNYFNLGADTTTNGDGDFFNHRNSAHLIRFGLNYLFPF